MNLWGVFNYKFMKMFVRPLQQPIEHKEIGTADDNFRDVNDSFDKVRLRLFAGCRRIH